MLSDTFKKERAQTVRDLANKANDPFIKNRLLDLAARYEDTRPRTIIPLTPMNLHFKTQGTGSEQ